MKYFLLSFAFILINLISFAQFENFDLSKYKLPDMKRHQLDFNFQSQGNTSSSFATYDFGTAIDTFQRKLNDFQGEAEFNYFYYRNSKRYQTNLNIQTSTGGKKTNNNGINIHDEIQSIYGNELSFSYDVKYFSKRKDWFLTAVPDFDISYSVMKDSDWDDDLKRFITTASLKIGGGKGRIEQIQDVRHAILILSEFAKRGILKRNPTENEIIELATLISEVKNLRFFDSRKRKEAELVAIDSFLSEKGIIAEYSVSYFTGLNDMWSYGGIQIRESGNQILLSATPDYYFYNSIIHNENGINETFSMNYNLIFISKKPISIKWQRDYDFGITIVSTNILQQRNDSYTEKKYSSLAFFSGTVGFYPNTRTNFNLSFRSNISNQSNDEVFDKENFSINFRIYTSAYYYISEKLRLGYNIAYNNGTGRVFNKELPNSSYNSFNYNLTFNYAIF